ncbi:hypothetical protein Hanom_Chr01g00084621 [Helianthus anomalus]
MRKKKKDPLPKIHNTRSVRKEETTVIKEQVESWWDSLISGDATKKDDDSSEVVRQKGDMETCVLSKSVSTVPTVSSCSGLPEKILSSEHGSLGRMKGSEIESTGSSFTVHGDESVNSSPSIMKKPDEDTMKPLKTASVYQVLDYANRNILIPEKNESPNVKSPLTPLLENISVQGKNEFDLWMLRSEVSRKSRTVESGNSLEKASENVTLIVDDISRGQMECSAAAVKDVTSGLSKNPNLCGPSDGFGNQRPDDSFDKQMDQLKCGLVNNPDIASGPVSNGSPPLENVADTKSQEAVPDITVTGLKITSPNDMKSGVSPGKPIAVNLINIDGSPDMERPEATLPSAVVTGRS